MSSEDDFKEWRRNIPEKIMSSDGMKYTFILEDSNSPFREIKHVHAGEQTWPELLVCFEDWLRGCGFQIDGHLEFIEDKPQSAANPDKELGTMHWIDEKCL